MDPFTISLIASSAIGIGQAIFGRKGQNRQRRENDRAAAAALADNLMGIGLRRTQEERAAALETSRLLRESDVLDGGMAAVAGAAGVGKLSTSLLTSTNQIRAAEAVGTVRGQLRNSMDALDYEERLAYTTFNNRRASVPAANPWATALQIGAVGINAYTTWQGRRAPTPGGR